MKKCLKIHIKQKLETKNDNVVADVAQCERSKIKCYASAFSNILIDWVIEFNFSIYTNLIYLFIFK